jgi:hypothetical protein
MNLLRNYRMFLLVVLLLGVQPANAQFQQLPTPIPSSTNAKSSRQYRIVEQALSLPFWDDFSSTGIDETKWINDGAIQSFTIPNSAPSLGAMVLDGIDERGAPYSPNRLERGFGDQITTRAIDLSTISASQANSVFLSFYWQPGGKAEMPDANDELSLLFKNAAGEWIEVWSQRGGLEANRNFFTLEMIPVSSDFHHSTFQFQFSSRGRISGPFDSWLVDYVYLNQHRSPSDTFIRDRALTEINARPFDKFTAIPLFEYQQRANGLWGRTGNEFNNLNNLFSPMEFTMVLQNQASGALIQSINSNTPINPVPLAFERRRFLSNQITTSPSLTQETDIELLTYLSTGDELLSQVIDGEIITFNTVDLRVNDTTRSVISIRDYFAYDDGKVDYSAGINQRSGMLANRFEVSTPSFVKGISINFTNFVQTGRVIDLMIWTNLNQRPIFVKEVFIPESQTLDEFSYFPIDENIRVGDIFFVGFTQFTNDFIYVGLDKSYDNGREIFFNVSGSWQQNELVEGSLMIRAHMSQTPVVEEQNEAVIDSPRVYPNPVTTRLFIQGKLQEVQVFDSFGRLLNLPESTEGDTKILNFEGLMKGIYLINIFHNNTVETKRILVN